VGGPGERTEDGGEDPAGSQAADGTPAAQGDMRRVRGDVRGPGTKAPIPIVAAGAKLSGQTKEARSPMSAPMVPPTIPST